jgi:CRP-like cAMP-binding protein
VYTRVPTPPEAGGILRTTNPGIATDILTNRLLAQLPDTERALLLSDAEYIVVPAGHTLASPGEPVSIAFFPDTGAFCWISDMRTGHQVAVALVGIEGLIGVSSVISIPRHPHRIVALFESAGHRLNAETLRRVFDESRGLRTAVLEHVGRQLVEVSTLVACARIHSHRQRLARWLLMMADKSDQSSLKITHDTLAQVVGGPRHAVTVSLNKLSADGTIAHLRGRVDILDRAGLLEHACECMSVHGS